MNKQDGQEILNVLQDFLNTEMIAGNRITKCNATYLAQTMTNVVNRIIAKYENQENIKKEIEEKRNKELNKQKETVKKVSDEIKNNKLYVLPVIPSNE